MGNVREINEDNLAAVPEHSLWVVADGMGGHEKGELASAIAVKAVAGGVARGLGLEEAVRKAHEEVLAAKDARPGMGSTVVALHFSEREYTVVWVGDSRAYLWDGRLWPLTRDHSLVQQLMDSGAINAQEAESHPQRSVITQAVGVAGKGGVKPGVRRGRLYRGEQILLCSDGLFKDLTEEEIEEIVCEGSCMDVCDRLIDTVLGRECADNVTVVVVEFNETTGG
ncbi:MAG: PP2C family serine/threonine-protein phosphatase [Pseudomonadales bacterium]